VTEAPPNFDDQVHQFAEKISTLLSRSLPGAPQVEITQVGHRARITPAGQTERSGGVPLFANGEIYARLRIDYLCWLDVTRQFLAVDASKIWILAEVDRTPIFRFEYLYDAEWVPHSHIQVHGQRGALSHLLSKTGHKVPHDMSALHLPTGGARFRPDLEDVIQFLIVDCKFDALDGWRDAVDEARAAWRAIQTRAVTRAMAAEAAQQLQSMGYTVTPPAGGHPEPGRKARFAW
jgi:hypothetical protein